MTSSVGILSLLHVRAEGKLIPFHLTSSSRSGLWKHCRYLIYILCIICIISGALNTYLVLTIMEILTCWLYVFLSFSFTLLPVATLKKINLKYLFLCSNWGWSSSACQFMEGTWRGQDSKTTLSGGLNWGTGQRMSQPWVPQHTDYEGNSVSKMSDKKSSGCQSLRQGLMPHVHLHLNAQAAKAEAAFAEKESQARIEASLKVE